MAAIVADRIIIELEARLADYNAKIAQAERRFDRSMGNMRGSASRAELSIARGMRNITAALGVVGTMALAKGILHIADEAKNLDAQLRLATAQTGNFGQAVDDVRRIAETTRSGLSETASLYGNFTRNAKDLGIGQVEAARATETFAKTLKISGASAVDAAQGTRQFIQGLQSGVLRGDEFNSIMENSPRLARLLAESLGVPIGALRAMAEEGQLTSDKLVRALTDTKFTDGIDAEFKALPVTFEQAMEQVENAAVITFGAFDRGGQFSTMLANFITDGTSGFADLEDAAEQTGINTRAAFEGLHDAFAPMLTGALEAFGIIGSRALSLRDSIASLLGSIDTLRNIPQDTFNYVSRRSAEVPNMLTSPFGVRVTGKQARRPSNLRGTFLRSFDQSQADLRVDARDRKFQDRFGGAGFQRFLNEPGRYGVFGNQVGGARAAPITGKAPKARKGPRGPSAETLARREEAARVAAERRQQAFQNEEAELQRDLIDARRALTKSAELAADYEKQEIETARAKYADNLASQVSRKKLTETEAERLRILNDQVAAERTRLVDVQAEERERREAASIREAGLETQQDLLRGDLRLAETREERLRIENRLIDLEFEMERARLDAIAASRDATDAEKEIARRRRAALPELEAQAREGVERANEGPLDRYRRELTSTAGDINTALEEIEVQGMKALEDSLVSATTKALGLKGALGQIVGELIRVAAQQAILAAIGGPGAAGGSLLGSLFKFANGGEFTIGGRGGTDRNVMSINGKPVAKVSRGERVTVTPQGKNIRPVTGMVSARAAPTIKNYTINVSADHSVTPGGFARGLAQQILQEAARMDRETARGTLQAVPHRLQQFSTNGT
jgi:tape measure domain-containing protein